MPVLYYYLLSHTASVEQSPLLLTQPMKNFPALDLSPSSLQCAQKQLKERGGQLVEAPRYNP